MTEADLAMNLGGPADLILDLQNAVNAVGDDAFIGLVRRHRDAWARAIFPLEQPFRAQLRQVGLPPPESMEALAVVSSHLSREASEGPVPSGNEVAELREHIESLLDEVAESDLPDEVKHLVLRRLQDILAALGHLSVRGPAAVRFAIEALVGSVAMSGADRDTSSPVSANPALRKLFAVLLTAYAVFSAGPTVQASLKAWPDVQQMVLGTGAHPQTPRDPMAEEPQTPDAR